MLPPLRYADGNILTTILADREVMSIITSAVAGA